MATTSKSSKTDGEAEVVADDQSMPTEGGQVPAQGDQSVLAEDKQYSLHYYAYDGSKWSDPQKGQPDVTDVYRFGRLAAYSYKGKLVYNYARFDAQTDTIFMEQRAFDEQMNESTIGIVGAECDRKSSTSFDNSLFEYKKRLFTLWGNETATGPSSTTWRQELWETKLDSTVGVTLVDPVALAAQSSCAAAVGVYDNTARMVMARSVRIGSSSPPLFERTSVDSSGVPEFETAIKDLGGSGIREKPGLAMFNGYLYMTYSASFGVPTPVACWRRYDGHRWSGETQIKPPSGPVPAPWTGVSASCVFNDRLYFVYNEVDRTVYKNNLFVTYLDKDTHRWSPRQALPQTGLTLADPVPIALAAHANKLYCLFIHEVD